jgi:Xaa-Pro aminopeptidase
MLSPSHFQTRRAQFLELLDGPVLLFAGGWIPRNYPANWQPFRADSTFLFFFPDPEPGAAALFDPADGSVTLFLDERTPEDALWHGSVPSFTDLKQSLGVSSIENRSALAEIVGKKVGDRRLRSLAIPDAATVQEARALTGEDLAFENGNRIGDPGLIAAIANLRLRRHPDELAEMQQAAQITREAHIAAMARTRPGIYEQELVGHVEGVFARHGCVPAYNTILSVRGEVLHNHRHDNILRETDLVLLDAGAENKRGYCADVTRTWPVNGRFSPEAADIYDIVLAAEMASIEAARPGARYRDLHLTSCRIVAEGLADLGILRGSADDLVETGAHALFFPHGVGHLIGLDVHDMEGFGDQVHYAPGRSRSEQFGLAYLRLDIDLEPGMCFTVEPGIYFVPAILRDKEFRKTFKSQVDFDKAEEFLTMNSLRGFGGIRIEDDVLCTEDGPEVISGSVPKDRTAIEALVGSAGS